MNNNKYLQTLLPGVINTIRRLRINKRRIRTSHKSTPTDHMSNLSNLQYVKTTDNHNQEVGSNMRIATLNARSVKKKEHLIVQQLHETNVDLAVITEMWLRTQTVARPGSISQNLGNQTITYYCRTDQVQRKVMTLHLHTDVNTAMTSHY